MWRDIAHRLLFAIPTDAIGMPANPSVAFNHTRLSDLRSFRFSIC